LKAVAFRPRRLRRDALSQKKAADGPAPPQIVAKAHRSAGHGEAAHELEGAPPPDPPQFSRRGLGMKQRVELRMVYTVSEPRIEAPGKRNEIIAATMQNPHGGAGEADMRRRKVIFRAEHGDT